MADDKAFLKKRAPTLYVIIAIKLLKGLLFVVLAIVAYTLSDNDLPAEFRGLLHHLRLNPERKFFADVAVLDLDVEHGGLIEPGRTRTKNVVGACDGSARVLELGDGALHATGADGL